MKRRLGEISTPFLLSPCRTHARTYTHPHPPRPQTTHSAQVKEAAHSSHAWPGSASPPQPPGPHPDLVPELLGLLSQLLQLTHGAGPVGRGWGRLGAAGRGLGEAAPGRWPEAWEGGMQG